MSTAPDGELARPTDAAPDDPVLPNFLVIGAHRAAMRWLKVNLAEHPQVFVADRPVRFFTDPDWSGGFRGYQTRFGGGRGATAVGDVDPDLLRSTRDLTHLTELIDSRLPDVRLIAIVREPVDRMCSAFRDHIIHGRLPVDADLLDMVRTEHPDVQALDLIGAGRYAHNLYPFRRRYGDRLLVVVHDDIRSNPAAVYDQVLAHLGLPIGFVPSRLDRVLYSNAYSKWGTSAVPSDKRRRTLAMLFREDVEELEEMLDRSLSAWDPGPPPDGWQSRLSPRQLADLGVSR